MVTTKDYRKKDQKKYFAIMALSIAVVVMAFVCIFVGSSNMTLEELI